MPAQILLVAVLTVGGIAEARTVRFVPEPDFRDPFHPALGGKGPGRGEVKLIVNGSLHHGDGMVMTSIADSDPLLGVERSVQAANIKQFGSLVGAGPTVHSGGFHLAGFPNGEHLLVSGIKVGEHWVRTVNNPDFTQQAADEIARQGGRPEYKRTEVVDESPRQPSHPVSPIEQILSVQMAITRHMFPWMFLGR